MKNKIVANFLVVIITTIACWQPAVLARDAGQVRFGSWDAVKAIPPGDKVEIKLKSGKTVKGEIDSVSDTSIILDRDGKSVTTARDDVQKLSQVTKKTPRTAIILGAAIGGAFGVAGLVASAKTDDRPDVSSEAKFLPLVGAATGALIGFAVGRKDKRVLIYEAN